VSKFGGVVLVLIFGVIGWFNLRRGNERVGGTRGYDTVLRALENKKLDDARSFPVLAKS